MCVPALFSRKKIAGKVGDFFSLKSCIELVRLEQQDERRFLNIAPPNPRILVTFWCANDTRSVPYVEFISPFWEVSSH
jgi:hypothetical protein